jgi:hypothetical protein
VRPPAAELALLPARAAASPAWPASSRDLVEEQRAAIGQLEASLPAIGGAREGALFVAEDLALEQRLGNRGAVDGDKREPCARTELMNRLRDELLAGARIRR